MKITNIDELEKKLDEVRLAQKKFSTYSQEKVDEI